MKKYTERRMREVTTDTFRIELNMPKEYPPIKARRTEDGGVRDRFFAAKAELPDEITVVRPYNVDAFANPVTLYVAEDGDDAAAGTKDAPIATLGAALDKAAGKGGAKIVLRGGSYEIDSPVKIGAEHSGTEKSPLIVTAEKGEVPMISAAKKIPASAFRKLTDEKMLARLTPEARENVLVADVKAFGITEFGEVKSAHLFMNSVLLTLARYPNDGEPLINVGERIVHTGFEDGERRGDWEIGMEDEKCLGWEWNDQIHIHGALCYEWNRYTVKIQAFDRENKTIRGFGSFERNAPVKPGDNNTYFFRNVFEELDVPGEWYLDRNDGKLYLWPPKALEDSDDIRFAAAPCNIFEVKGAKKVILDGIDAGRCIGGAFTVEDSEEVLIQRCHVTGTCSLGEGRSKGSVDIKGGKLCGAIASKIEHFTGYAVVVLGGDRVNLIPANHFAQNLVIVNPHNRHATSTGGCGNVFSHNYLHNTTIGDGGHNEGIIEYNVVEGGDTETHDSGMIYVAGGGCSSCANHYRYNYFFDFRENDYGIYFDDLSRGMYAYGNIVVGNGYNEDGSWHSGGRGYNHHNGGEHCYYNNVSIDAGYFAFGGDITYWLFDSNWNSLAPGILGASLDKRTEKYMGRNPTYRDYCEAVDQYFEDKKDPNYVVKSGWAERRLRTPWCNNYENNVIVRAARPFKLDNGEETATCLDTNYITDDDPGFVDFEGRDYTIREDAPLYKKIPDFEPIPFRKMGPVDDFDD
ncbi:MAG: right-handed parallel beta-helix repeat-containing protein [Clostridia bacterium]|nr:right-handed parallel beta-helix repeat-containing protein [Clostridia bacterium]